LESLAKEDVGIFIVILYILLSIFYGHLIHFVATWYMNYYSIGMLHLEKYDSPVLLMFLLAVKKLNGFLQMTE
jgi:hypothetical protein